LAFHPGRSGFGELDGNLKIKDTPFYGNQLFEAVSPKTLFEVDRKTVDRIKIVWVLDFSPANSYQ
jgi:hypothetical protein